MNVLAIDTSTEVASLALMVKGEILSEKQNNIKTHAKMLLPMIDRLLLKAAVAIEDLDAIVFGQGPGSFTGLRIACSIAKGLAHAHDIPLIPVSTLAAIAWEARQKINAKETAVLAVLDARMNELYWGVYKPEKPAFAEEHVCAAGDIHVAGEKALILAGIGIDTYRDQFSAALKGQIIQQTVIYPEASAMIMLANTAEIQKISAAEAQPVYIRNKVTQGEPRG